jgi:hypothetical protein
VFWIRSTVDAMQTVTRSQNATVVTNLTLDTKMVQFVHYEITKELSA